MSSLFTSLLADFALCSTTSQKITVLISNPPISKYLNEGIFKLPFILSVPSQNLLFIINLSTKQMLNDGSTFRSNLPLTHSRSDRIQKLSIRIRLFDTDRNE
ncbi:hypothetical protein BDB00DRAFT_824720 [Zychaea mexicana]|uniref:uncharacterized protein n=1 Tax=Zychaea mexicana TaxID=64656 RepID=UPI0022FEE3E3|nr:uncharacterized protein BDB00DRAFT_824720 [Zychaea mexicana]KAI9493183.1 hypothetical protein BDB00DRAFT_824720 [Zychaea mexicana]